MQITIISGMNGRRFAILVLIPWTILALLLALFALLPPVQASDIIVYPGDSIQAAINGAGPGDTIVVQAGIYTESLTLDKAVSLTGVNSRTTIIRAIPGQRVLAVTGSAIDQTTLITGLTFAHGDISSGGNCPTNCGGGILLTDGARPRIRYVILENNLAAHGGGLYAATGSPLWLDHSLVVSNTTTDNNLTTADNGGGVLAGDAVTVTHGLFQGNRCLVKGSGGGLLAIGFAAIDGTRFVRNTASAQLSGLAYGGGAAVNQAAIRNSHFAQNSCVSNTGCSGGGLASFGAMSVQNSDFRDNVSQSDGAGIWANGPLTVNGGHFTGNYLATLSEPYSGGGLFALGPLLITGTSFISNSAGGFGGAVGASGPVTVTAATFRHNHSENEGGGLFADADAYVARTRFISNTAAGGGGMAAGRFTNASDRVTIVNNLFHDNHASSGTGGELLLDTPGLITLTHNTVVATNDSAQTAVSIITGTAFLTNNIISGYATGVRNGGTALVTEGYNLYFGNDVDLMGIISGGNSLFGLDPRFVAPGQEDFQLDPASPALDNAQDLGIPDDLAGNPRPRGSGPDRGALELQVDPAPEYQLFMPVTRRS